MTGAAHKAAADQPIQFIENVAFPKRTDAATKTLSSRRIRDSALRATLGKAPFYAL
jgi:hypothetical protein